MVPVKALVVTADCGLIPSESDPEVEELKVAVLVVVNVVEYAPLVCVYPVILPNIPALDNLCVPPVERTPLERLMVALASVAVPVEAPSAKVVAGPPIFKVVVEVLRRATVV